MNHQFVQRNINLSNSRNVSSKGGSSNGLFGKITEAGSIHALQSSFGNRAVQRMLSNRSSVQVIQRAKFNVKGEEHDTTNLAEWELIAMAETIVEEQDHAGKAALLKALTDHQIEVGSTLEGHSEVIGILEKLPSITSGGVNTNGEKKDENVPEGIPNTSMKDEEEEIKMPSNPKDEEEEIKTSSNSNDVESGSSGIDVDFQLAEQLVANTAPLEAAAKKIKKTDVSSACSGIKNELLQLLDDLNDANIDEETNKHIHIQALNPEKPRDRKILGKIAAATNAIVRFFLGLLEKEDDGQAFFMALMVVGLHKELLNYISAPTCNQNAAAKFRKLVNSINCNLKS